MPAQPKLFGDNPRYERWRWQIFAVTWLAYAGFYLTRKSFSVAKVELAKPAVLGLSKADMSWVDGANSVAYALGQFGWGIMGDKFGTRVVILVGMLGSVLLAMLSGGSKTAFVLGCFVALQGLVQASGWAPLAKNISEFFSRRERGRIMGWWCTNYAFGGFVASLLAGLAVRWGGSWRYAFWIPAMSLLVIWILFILFQRNRPEDVGLPAIEQYHGEPEASPSRTVETQEPEGSWKLVGEVLQNRMVWLLAAVYSLVKPTRYLILYWAPVYVNERLGTGTTESGILGSMFDLAGPIGTLAGGYLSDRLFQSRRMPVGIIALLSLAVLMIGFRYLPLTRIAIGAGLFAAGFLVYIPDSLISGTAAIDFGTKKGASTASGVVNGCGSIGQIIGVTLPGWIGKFLGQGHEIWNPIFFGLGVALVLAALLLVPQWNRVPATSR